VAGGVSVRVTSLALLSHCGAAGQTSLRLCGVAWVAANLWDTTSTEQRHPQLSVSGRSARCHSIAVYPRQFVQPEKRVVRLEASVSCNHIAIPTRADLMKGRKSKELGQQPGC
jgi:hypothetical protein